MAPSKRVDSSEISLKALVFADSCDGVTSSFSALDSVHNVPVLTWQLAVLARYGVQEAIVLSREPIEIPYADPLDRMKVTPLCNISWACEGDALREVEIRSDLRPQDDFVIVRTGAIFNLNVLKLLMEHKQRRTKDRNWLLTSVFSRNFASGNVVMSINGEGMILKYDESNGVAGINISVGKDVDNNSVDIFSNVADVGVDICAPEVLLEFKECFDYNRVRDLTIEKLDSGDAETMGNKMYARFIDEGAYEYAARVVSLKQLLLVSADVRNGFMMPVELENHAAENNNTLGINNSKLNQHAKVSGCVVGDGVSIGSNAVVKNSIIGNGAKIGDNAHVDSCIVMENCTVGKDAWCAECVLDKGVVIGEGFQINQKNALITTRRDEDFESKDDEDDSESETGETKITKTNGTHEANTGDEGEVGSGGVGRIVSASVASNVDPFFSTIETAVYTSESDDDADDGGIENAGEMAEEETNGASSANVQEEFRREMYELIEKGLVEKVELDNTLLEANSLRMVYDVTFAEMLSGVIIAIARNAMKEEPDNVFAAYNRCFRKYSGLTSKYVVEEDGTEVVTNVAKNFENEGMQFSRLAKVLYDTNIVEEDAILGWAKKDVPPVENTRPLSRAPSPSPKRRVAA